MVVSPLFSFILCNDEDEEDFTEFCYMLGTQCAKVLYIITSSYKKFVRQMVVFLFY